MLAPTAGPKPKLYYKKDAQFANIEFLSHDLGMVISTVQLVQGVISSSS